MAPLSAHVENTLGWLFYRVKGHDQKLLSRLSSATADLPATVKIVSSELGDSSPGRFTAGTHELLGDNNFPSLSWTADSKDEPNIRSWLLVVEDADAPLPSPIVHGIYHDIPADKRALATTDFKDASDGKLSGGFRYGANRRGTIWTGPRPVLGHGDHRYFFQLFGLSVEEFSSLGAEKLSKEALLQAQTGLQGKVVCWGEYVASFERKL